MYFSRYWWIGLVLFLGIIGWITVEKKNRGVRLWTGGGIIAGVLLSWVVGPHPYRQYFAPGLFCLVLFAPYIGALGQKKVTNALGIFLLAFPLTHMSIQYTQSAATALAIGWATEDEGTYHLFKQMAGRQKLLDLIPPDERVISPFSSHPIFRENLTFVTHDVPGGFLSVLPINSLAWNYFQSKHLAVRLEREFPALICLDKIPMGWDRVLTDFLRSHGDQYQPFDITMHTIHIRKDLLPKSENISIDLGFTH